ncbi:cupin domain-containing protein [Agrobacterium rhizogenes]|nr:cupin domain-containing protein [Rhizobium rhizogenes]NTH62059.1 cupin domain-containing protein [Rhizobium rhizogenes]NTH93685.1 cupin domain-containing protein [Rhizobium rhizogenes]
MPTSSALDAEELSEPLRENLGARLRHFRTKRDLTIAQLAALAGVSSGIISQIERGSANPSVKTLQRIRRALGVNLWEFLEDTQSNSATKERPPRASTFVCREADRQRIVVGATKLVKELLSPRNDRNLRFMVITLPPGAESEDVIMGMGEKGGVVTEGQVRLMVDSEETALVTGDSFQFPSSLPHKISNPFSRPAKVIWIMSVLESHI